MFIIDHTYTFMASMVYASSSSLFMSGSDISLSHNRPLSSSLLSPPPFQCLQPYYFSLFPTLPVLVPTLCFLYLSLSLILPFPSLCAQYDSAFSCIFIFALSPARALSICPACTSGYGVSSGFSISLIGEIHISARALLVISLIWFDNSARLWSQWGGRAGGLIFVHMKTIGTCLRGA